MADEKRTYTQEEVDALVAENVSGLKANREEALREAKAAKAALKSYEGVDAAEYKALKDAAAAAEQKKAAAEGDFKSLEKQLVDRHAAEMGAKDARMTKLERGLHQRLIEAELTKAIAKHGADPELLLPHAERFARVKETEDGFEAFVADEKGNPLVSDGKGTPMDFDTLVGVNLKAKFPAAFPGTGSSGGGSSRSTGGAGGTRTVASGDNAAFLANLEGIAAGTAAVG